MIYFRSDYSLGAHPKVMEALMATNMEHTDGYALDRFSLDTADMIRELIGKSDAHVHFLVGGTPTNTILIAAALRPYEGAISADSGHISFTRRWPVRGDRSPRICSAYRRRQTSPKRCGKSIASSRR